MMAELASNPRLASVMEILTEAAVAGQRCPTQDGIEYALEKRGISPGAKNCPGQLAALGLIRIEICGRNYRVIEILAGPQKGARTLGHKYQPHWIIDHTGHRRIRHAFGNKLAAQK